MGDCWENLGAGDLASKPIFHAKTKHIEVDVHFVREKIATNQLEIRYVSIEEQVTDTLTKALGEERFRYFREKLKVHKPSLV